MKTVWSDKFENVQYVRCLSLAQQYHNLTIDQCVGQIVHTLDSEGVPYDKERLRTGKYNIDDLVKMMITSSAERISAVVTASNRYR